MAFYPFRAEDGEEIEVEAPMQQGIPIGKRLKRGGKWYRRIPVSTFMPGANHGKVTPGYVFRSQQVEQGLPGVNYDSEGVACFNGRRETEEFCKRSMDNASQSGFTIGQRNSALTAERVREKRKHL